MTNTIIRKLYLIWKTFYFVLKTGIQILKDEFEYSHSIRILSKMRLGKHGIYCSHGNCFCIRNNLPKQYRQMIEKAAEEGI
jgi:hypothetical protein